MNEFNDVIQYFDDSTISCLMSVPESVKEKINEIRIKVDEPIVIITIDNSYYLSYNGVSDVLCNGLPIISRNKLNICIKKMCSYSFCSYETQINHGYITLKNGHRVGVSGAFSDTGAILSCDDIYSLNVRISRRVTSFGEKVAKQFLSNSGHLLICGPPSCGKTTLIRDVASSLSAKKVKLCIVDERNEIAANVNGKTGYRLGAFCDVISNCPKSRAAEIAVRTMSPDVIVFDEIGFNDCETLYRLSNAGVRIIATFHSFNDCGNSFILDSLHKYGFYATVAVLPSVGREPVYTMVYGDA